MLMGGGRTAASHSFPLTSIGATRRLQVRHREQKSSQSKEA
jgi:hypothetical protein